MNIFLTGELHIGKSTVVKKVINKLNISVDGFNTYFAQGKTPDSWDMYMGSATAERIYDDAHCVAYRRSGFQPVVLREMFDGIGFEFVNNSGKNGKLTVMDELGFLENDAVKFKNAVIERLKLDEPVLGIIKLKNVDWHNEIKNMKSVKVFVVTEENRNMLPDAIIEMLNISSNCCTEI